MRDDVFAAGEGLLDELPLGIWVGRAPGGEPLYTNRSFRTIIGMPAVSHVGVRAWSATYNIRDREGNPYPADRLAFSRAIACGGPVVVDDLVVLRPDGSQAYVRAFANPVRDAQGGISHVVVALTDITAEVRATVERAQIQEHLEVAIHHAPVLLFMINEVGVVTAADGAIKAVLERDGHRLVGNSLFESYKNNPVVVDNVRRALAGETVSYSVSVRGLELDVWLGPVRNAAGALSGAIGVCTDVTAARQAQSTIIQEDRIRAIGTVAASVAHEINNPLTYVLASLDEAQVELNRLQHELEAAGPSVDPTKLLTRVARLKRHLEPVNAGTKRIRDVARELKTFTRPDDERLTQVEIPSVVRSVLSLLRKEIEARAQLIEEIGPTPIVCANEARLVQVLTNLLINAWQAIPPSEPATQVIGVRSGSLNGEALIEIWDSGVGVGPELRERIFEPFVTTKEVGSGTGLGLFVCRNIVSSLQGRISVHDAPGRGALFRITLPAMAVPVEATALPSARPAPSESRAPAGGRLRVLIIDDDPRVASALASSLEQHLFDVWIELDPRRGLASLLADPGIDLVYCDVMMRELTGIDVYEALRRQAPEHLTKVVFMTGGAFTTEARSFFEQLGDRLVEKPFDIRSDARRRVTGVAAATL